MIRQVLRLASPRLFLPFFEDVEPAAPGTVLVRPLTLAVCAADQRYFLGERPEAVLRSRLPMALIHEAVGVVLHSAAAGFAPGDRAVLLPFADDGNDPAANYREGARFRSSNADGFTQEVLALTPGELLRIDDDPEHLDFHCLCEPLSVCLQALGRFEARVGAPGRGPVGIWGDGPMAYLMALCLRHRHPGCALTVFGLDDAKLARFSFAERVVNAAVPGGRERVAHGFECVGGTGAAAAIDDALERLLPGGGLCLLGVSETPPPVRTRAVLEKGLTLLGSSRSSRRDCLAAEAMIRLREVRDRLHPLVSRKLTVVDGDGLASAFEAARQGPFKTLLEWRL